MSSSDIESGRAGGLFSDFLKEQGTYEATTRKAIQEILADQITAVMQTEGLSKVAMAQRLKTSCSQLDNLLDPENDEVTLHTMKCAARAVGRKLTLELR